MDVKLDNRAINIKDLGLPSPKPQEAVFNPENYVPIGLLSRVEAELGSNNIPNWKNYDARAALFALVFPERFSKFYFDDESVRALEKYYLEVRENPRLQNNLEEICYPALAAKACFPGKIPIDEEIRDQIQAKVNNEMTYTHSTGLWSGTGFWLYFGELLSSDKDDMSQKQTKAGLIYQTGLLDKAKEAGDWYLFMSVFDVIKLLDPNVAKKIELDTETWEGMLQVLSRSTSDQEFLVIALKLKILASERVEVTPNRINIVMPSTQAGKEAEIVLPTTRKF